MNQKYNQLNIITFVAMIMIFTIHYFNSYTNIITSNRLLIIVSVLRGVALIAVPLYITNIGYTNIYLNKEVNFKKIYIYIILPTISLTQMNLTISGTNSVFWNTNEGFSNSWFADMYVPLMLVVPLIQYIYNKSKISKRILVVLSLIGLSYAYMYSLNYSATLLGLGIWVFVPYIPMLIVLTYAVFEIKIKSKLLLVGLFFLCTLAIGYGYYQSANPMIPKLVFFNSYFGPLAIIATIAIFKLIYDSNLSIPYLRFISRSSYFFYFTHHAVLKIYYLYFYDLVEKHLLRFYILGIVISLILSTFIFQLYKWILIGLKIER